MAKHLRFFRITLYKAVLILCALALGTSLGGLLQTESLWASASRVCLNILFIHYFWMVLQLAQGIAIQPEEQP